jgi:amino acid transporter
MSQAAVPLAMFLGGLMLEYQDIMFVAYFSMIMLILIIVYLFSNKNVTSFWKTLDNQENETMN